MRIGVLSDTHFASLAQGRPLLERLLAGPFRDVEMILHAGDIVDPAVLDAFAATPVYAVRGNLDHSHPQLPVKRIVTAAGRRIGMIHGWGAPTGLPERVLREFADESLDVLVFGHSHFPYCRLHRQTLLFNPGSPTDRRSAPRHSVGLLDLSATVVGEVVPIDGLVRGGR